VVVVVVPFTHHLRKENDESTPPHSSSIKWSLQLLHWKTLTMQFQKRAPSALLNVAEYRKRKVEKNEEEENDDNKLCVRESSKPVVSCSIFCNMPSAPISLLLLTSIAQPVEAINT
jgi:hypothetical protein